MLNKCIEAMLSKPQLPDVLFIQLGSYWTVSSYRQFNPPLVMALLYFIMFLILFY